MAQQRAHTGTRCGRGSQKRNLAFMLIPGLGFAAVDQTPQMQLRPVKNWTNPVRDDAASESASCFCCTSLSRAPIHRSVLRVGKCCYGWRNLAPCRALTLAPVFLCAHAPVQRMRLWCPCPRNAEGLRGPACPSLRSKAPFPLDVPVVAKHRLCAA